MTTLSNFLNRSNRPTLARYGWALLVLSVIVGLAIAILPLSQVVLVIAALAGIVGVAMILAEPAIGMALTLFAGPFEPLESIMFHLPISSGQALLILTLAAWGVRIIVQRRLGIRAGPLVWPLAAFLGIGALSFFAASSAELWLKECIKWAEVLAVYLFVVSQLKSNPRTRTIILGGILVSTLFEAGLGIYQFGLRGTGPQEFLITGRYYRAYGTFEQPNPFGGYMGLTWPLAAIIAFFSLRQALRFLAGPLRRSREAWQSYSLGVFSLVVALCSVVALVLSWSRGAWLGAGAAVVIIFIVALRKPAASLSIVAVVAVIVVAFNLVDLLPASLRSRLTDFTQEFSSFDVRGVTISSSNYSVIERLAHWQAAENMIVDRPFFGVGFGNYGAAYEQYRTLNWPIALGHAHNYYLNIWAETGIFGLLIYLFLWGAIFYRTIKTFVLNVSQAGHIPSSISPPYLAEAPPSLAAAPPYLAAAIALGLVGSWVQLSVHQLVDNLYVANIFLLIGAYLGLLDSLTLRSGD